MVGIVLVSHSAALADGVLDITGMMAPDCPVAVAATISSMCGDSLETVRQQAVSAGSIPKF